MSDAACAADRACGSCGSPNLQDEVPLGKLSVNYLSGLVLKSKPIHGSVCLDCGKVELHLDYPSELKDRELVRSGSGNFLPFIIFALFILSLQLD